MCNSKATIKATLPPVLISTSLVVFAAVCFLIFMKRDWRDPNYVRLFYRCQDNCEIAKKTRD